MAIGDKKSGLQPSSVQAQQYRLQFTNLQPVSATAQQPSPVTNPRTTVSAFAGVPAPISLPTPQSAVSQTPAAVPSTFRQAAFFDGATVYSASLATGNDFKAQINDNLGSFSVDLIFKPAAPDSLRHTIFHTYSGSFMSQSLELYITGSNLILEFTNGTANTPSGIIEAVSIFSRDLNYLKRIGYTEHMTNGFTYSAARYNSYVSTNIEFKFKANTFPIGASPIPANPNVSLAVQTGFNTANNTHFYVGGSPAKNSYYSGSIASITFTTGSFFTNQQWGDMALRDLDPTTVSPQLRTYTFNNAPAEFTGSQASFSRPLVLVAGTPSYVDSYLKL